MPETGIGDLQLVQWTGLVARWFHVIVGAMWIGASFYIISWENKFKRQGLREGIAGEFWTIQGGDFYFVEKQRDAPPRLPEELHWFKYEAYLTWVSGFVLLILVFYLNAGTLMVDPSVADLTPGIAVGLSLTSLLVAALAYEAYCRTAVARNLRASGAVGLAFVALLTVFYTEVFSARAALVHVGAALGTIMSANVFFVIIPWHRVFIRAIEEGAPLEPLLASRPGYRSRHNHYMTVPVFFLMLSGHFAVVLSRPHLWLVVPAIALAGVLVKHGHNELQRKRPWLRYVVGGGVVLLAVVGWSAAAGQEPLACAHTPTDAQAMALVETRCGSCHGSTPTDDVWTTPPNGVVLEQAEQVLALAGRVRERVVVTRTMPLDNKTGMTMDERRALGCWIAGFGGGTP